MSEMKNLIGVAIIATIAIADITGAFAAQTIEEIIVTARKREESLQEVPVSISAFTGEQLAEKVINRASELARFVPSLSIEPQSQSTSSVAVYSLRGQSQADILLTFDPAVGVYVDGVNISKPTGGAAAYFDVERVEVLKGSQGTLYGRNTTGGAVNYFTRRPDYDGVHGYASIDGGDYDLLNFRAAINVPLVEDRLAVRLGGQHYEHDGYVDSTFTDDTRGDRDETIFRFGAIFDPTESVHVDLSFDWVEMDDNGGTHVPWQWVSNFDAAAWDPVLNPIAGASLGTFQVAFEETGCMPFVTCSPVELQAAEDLADSVTASSRDDIYVNDADAAWHETTLWGIGATIEIDLLDNVTLKSITGYREMENDRLNELDAYRWQVLLTGAEIPEDAAVPFTEPNFLGQWTDIHFPRTKDQDMEAITQEINLSGLAMDDRLEWLGGAYYSNEKGQDYAQFYFAPAFLGLPFIADGYVTTAHDGYKVEATSWAFFSQMTFALTDVWSVTAGGRYTEETKEFTGRNRQYRPLDATIRCVTEAVPFVPDNPTDLSGAECERSDSINFDGWSYLFSVEYQPSDDLLVYAKTAKGFRGGGWQLRAPDQPPFEPERSTDYEVGIKSDFLEDRLRVNAAYYHTQYDNKQESIIVLRAGASATIVQNAADATINGIELEVTAYPAERLMLGLTYGWLDGEYDTFPGALPITGGAPVDASGEQFPNPEHSYTISARYELALGSGTLGMSADWQWRDKFSRSERLTDPLVDPEYYEVVDDSVGLLNASIDYDIPDWAANVQLFATNLLDEEWQRAGINHTNLGGAQNALTMPPRMWGVRLTKSFGNE